jgi:hypothetical protein
MTPRVLPFSDPLGSPEVRRMMRASGRPLHQGATLNSESTAVAWLFQHAETKTRLRLFEVLLTVDHECAACSAGRATATRALDSELESCVQRVASKCGLDAAGARGLLERVMRLAREAVDAGVGSASL